MGQPEWSQEEHSTLITLRRDGVSYSRAAKRITATFGISRTRCAVIAYADRKGIPELLKSVVTAKDPKAAEPSWLEARVARAKDWKPHNHNPEPIATPDARPQMTRKPGECTWMIADAGPAYDWNACCSPVHERPDGSKSPYCPGHHDIAFRPAPEVVF